MWRVSVEAAECDSSVIMLHDAKSVFGEYLALNKVFFDDLYLTVRRRRNYCSGLGIKSVTGLDCKDWSSNSWFLIMARDKNNLDFWVLIKQEPDQSGRIVGVGPDEFIEYLPASGGFPFHKVVEAIVNDPKRWKKLLVLVN